VQSARLRYRSLYRRGSLGVGWLLGRTIERVERVGKNAVFRLRSSGLMVVNLGMTGRLIAHRANATVTRLARGPLSKHLHGRFRLDGDIELRYYDARRFGHFYIAEQCDFLHDLNVGPDPFVAKTAYLGRTLDGRQAPIKALLLDQRILSGIGNIYADEMLFYAGIDPRVPGDEVAGSARRLLSNARSVLRRAIRHGGTTLRDYCKPDGSKGAFQNHHAVYGREGDPCVHCSTPIRKIVLAGRGTHFCPRCQT
jgi:formamidopyrimidine-DNA glycosylase